MFDPSFTYLIQDHVTGVLHQLQGHQVGQLVIREITEPFKKTGRDGTVAICEDHFGLEHWGLMAGVLTVERFETALFIADALSLEMPEEVFATIGDFYEWLTERAQWLVETKATGDSGESMKPLRHWRAEIGASS